MCPGREVPDEPNDPCDGGDAWEHRGMTAYAAFLRVYEPLAAFEGEQRRRWEDYLGAGDAPAAPRASRWSGRPRCTRSSGGAPQVMPQVAAHAFVTEVDGVTLVCPWHTRLRALEAFEEFRGGLPDELADAFVPREAADAAGDRARASCAPTPRRCAATC